MNDAAVTFGTISEVCRYLDDRGFRATTSTVTRDFHKGLFGRNREGRFDAEIVLKYAELHRKRADSGKRKSVEDFDLQRERAEAELEKIREQTRLAEVKRMKEEGRLVPRDLYEKDLAARLAFFSNQLEALAVTVSEGSVLAIQGRGLKQVSAMIEMVGGDQGKAMDLAAFLEGLVPDLVAVFLAHKASWLEAFAADRVHVVDLEPYLECEVAQDAN